MVERNDLTDPLDAAREALEQFEKTRAAAAPDRWHLPWRVHRLLVRAAVSEILARPAT